MKVQKKASEMTPRELAAYIDQSVLKSEFTQEEIRKWLLFIITISQKRMEKHRSVSSVENVRSTVRSICLFGSI